MANKTAKIIVSGKVIVDHPVFPGKFVEVPAAIHEMRQAGIQPTWSSLHFGQGADADTLVIVVTDGHKPTEDICAKYTGVSDAVADGVKVVSVASQAAVDAKIDELAAAADAKAEAAGDAAVEP
jgi:hypothetical protein